MSNVAASKNSELEQRVQPELLRSNPPTFSSLNHRMLIIGICIFALVALGIWWLFRERRKMHRTPETEYLILESSVTIEIDGGIEFDYEDDEFGGRESFETLLDSATPQRLAFDLEKIPTFHVNCKPGNILERRGKRTLKLRPSHSGEADMALVDIREGRLTVSPFSSKKEPKFLGDFPIMRRRTPKMASINGELSSGISTAPNVLESTWRPLDTGDLPSEKP